jgi:hypothetical protein
MKKTMALSNDKQQFLTFLIKKSPNGKIGLWFVMIFVPSLGNFTTLSPVRRKIEENGLPKDLGDHVSFTLGGNIKLLGQEGAGPNEMAYVERICQQGLVKWTLRFGTDAFKDRETLFKYLLSVEDKPT